MNIHENTALLDAFTDGELTAEEMAEVQAHLEICPNCRAYVDDLLAIRAAFPTVEDTVLPAEFTKKVMEAVANAPQSRPKKQPWGKLLAAAACLAVIVLVQRAGLGGAAGNADTAAYSTADCAVEESAVVERGVNTAAEADDAEVPAEEVSAAEPSEQYDSATVYTSGTLAAKNADAPTATQNGAAADESTETEAFPTVRITASEIGELLAEREPEETDADCVRYLLTRAEFDALAAGLAERDILLADDSGSDCLLLEVVNG